MCITAPGPRRARTLWWALVGYFRHYPPLVQGETLPAKPDTKRSPETPRAKRPPIRIYW